MSDLSRKKTIPRGAALRGLGARFGAVKTEIRAPKKTCSVCSSLNSRSFLPRQSDHAVRVSKIRGAFFLPDRDRVTGRTGRALELQRREHERKLVNLFPSQFLQVEVLQVVDAVAHQ